jgi:hypothetical protein
MALTSPSIPTPSAPPAPPPPAEVVDAVVDTITDAPPPPPPPPPPPAGDGPLAGDTPSGEEIVDLGVSAAQGFAQGAPEIAFDVGVRVGASEVNVEGDSASASASASGETQIGGVTSSGGVSAGSGGVEVDAHLRTGAFTSDFEAAERVTVTDEGIRGSGSVETSIDTGLGGTSFRTETTEDGESTTDASVSVAVGDVAVDGEVSITGLGGTPVADVLNATDASADVLVDAVDDAVDFAADGSKVLVDTIDDVQPDIQLVNDSGVTVTRDADGTITVDQFAEIGVEVDDNRVTVGHDGVLTSDGSNSSAVGDAGVRVTTDDGEFATGVTAGQSVSDDGRATSTGAGVFVERDDDRVETGVFRDGTNDGGLLPENTGSDVGVYASHNDDTVRAGFEDRTNSETFDAPPSSGVFVEDVDGDRTGIGTIAQSDVRGDVYSFGSGGVYVDVDGERHDAHITRTAGSTFDDVSESSFTGVQDEYDLGPISATGRIGLETDADDDGDGNVDGRFVADVVVEDEFGALDDLLPDELLGDDQPDATSAAVGSNEQVTVHDELGNPIANADGSATSDDASAPDLNEASDPSVFSDIADSIGDAATGAVDAVQDFFEDLIGGGDE